MTNTIGINIKETTVKKIPLVGNKTVKIRRNCVKVTFGVNKGNIGELFVANKWVKISSFNRTIKQVKMMMLSLKKEKGI